MTRFIYGIIPVFFEFTDDIHPATVEAAARGLKVKMRPQFANDEPKIQHELEHARQNVLPWRSMSRLEKEVGAYRVQLKHYPVSEREARITELAVNLCAHEYGFNLTQAEAEAMLR